MSPKVGKRLVSVSINNALCSLDADVLQPLLPEGYHIEERQTHYDEIVYEIQHIERFIPSLEGYHHKPVHVRYLDGMPIIVNT